MQTDTSSPSFDNVSTKLIAAGVIVVCLLLGFAGLIQACLDAVLADLAARGELSPALLSTLQLLI